MPIEPIRQSFSLDPFVEIIGRHFRQPLEGQLQAERERLAAELLRGNLRRLRD